jgi:hypothetical protein
MTQDVFRRASRPGLISLAGLLAAFVLLAGCVATAPAPVEEPPAAPAADATDAPTATPLPEAEAAADEAAADDAADDTPEPVRLGEPLWALGYSADGSTLVLGTAYGLYTFTDDVWTRSSTPPRYYAGFSPVADGFYSSGTHEPGSDALDPLGLVKSEDVGETLTSLAFAGESLFNQMGAGYRSNAIYVINEEENSVLPPGLHYTEDDGATWGTSAAQGIRAATLQVSVHPDEPAVVALPSYAGLYLSTDYGNTFAIISDGFGEGEPTVSAATFSPAEAGVLIYGFRTLVRAGLDDGNPEPIPAPQVSSEDAILSIAVNPTNPDEIAFATYERVIWRTTDGGASWDLIGMPAVQ